MRMVVNTTGETTLDDLAARFAQIDNLFEVAEYIAAGPPTVSRAMRAVSSGMFLPPRVSQRVVKVSMNSPLEIVVMLSGSVGAVSGTAYTLLKLFDKFQESRQKLAFTSTYVAAQNVIKAELQGISGQLLETVVAELPERVNGAAKAIEGLKSVQIISETEGGKASVPSGE